MSNHRKKQVRCTMCNPFSWMGNKEEKIPIRDRRKGISKKHKQQLALFE
jgi:hypothetical protein